MEQLRLILKAGGVPQDKIDQAVAQRVKMIAILRTEPDLGKAAVKLRELMGPKAPKDQVADALIATINTAWFREFFDYEPAPTLRKVRCPVPWRSTGARTLQVSPPRIGAPRNPGGPEG